MGVHDADPQNTIAWICVAEEGVAGLDEEPGELGMLLELQPLDVHKLAPASTRPRAFKRRIPAQRSRSCLDSFGRRRKADVPLRENVAEEPRFDVCEQMCRGSERKPSVDNRGAVMRIEEPVGTIGAVEMQICDHGSTFREARPRPNARCASSIGTQTGPSMMSSGQTHHTPTVSALRRNATISGSRGLVSNARR